MKAYINYNQGNLGLNIKTSFADRNGLSVLKLLRKAITNNAIANIDATNHNGEYILKVATDKTKMTSTADEVVAAV